MRARLVIAALTFGLTAAASGFAQTVTQVVIHKVQVNDQTSFATATSRNASPSCSSNRSCPYFFKVYVRGQGLASIPAPVLSGPIDTAGLGALWNNGRLSYDASLDSWELTYGTQTQGDLDAKFGNGTYTVAVNGTNVTLNVPASPMPNTPLFTVSGGSWGTNRYEIDPRQPLSIATNAFATYGSQPGDSISLNVFIPGGCCGTSVGSAYQVAASQPGQNTLTFTLPSGTLVDGGDYGACVTFFAELDHPAVAGQPQLYAQAHRDVLTCFNLKAQIAQPFGLLVNTNITPTVTNVAATIQVPLADDGKTGSIYSFFVAPKTKVVNAATMEKGASLGGMKAKSHEKAVAVECVLAQLNASGQLQAVSAANLQAYVTGVLSSQGQAVSMANNVPTVNIAGSTLYIGYVPGTDPLAMISKGTNRRAAQVPGEIQCDPQAPETGWWWNTAEGGRGYSIEVAGNHIFFAAYLYDTNGRATWYTASGPVWLDNSVFPGNLESYSNGQTLSGAYKAPSPVTLNGPITLAFTDAQTGTMTWPGGTVGIQRFDIVVGGSDMKTYANQPQGGWWWSQSESGRGFFLEWQGGELFMAGYMYDDDGKPIWYLSTNTTPSTNLMSYTGTWWQYANGQTLMGAYKPATRINDNLAPVSIAFENTERAVITFPNGRTSVITRFRF